MGFKTDVQNLTKPAGHMVFDPPQNKRLDTVKAFQMTATKT